MHRCTQARQVPSVLPPPQQHFESIEDANEAIKLLDGSDIDGSKISVEVGSRFSFMTLVHARMCASHVPRVLRCASEIV